MRKRYAKLLGLACLIGAMGLLPSSQSRAAGWLKDGNYWYYMTDDGQKHTGWVHIGEKYYYMDDSTGKMVTGWRQDSSTSAWYYFNQSGEMMTKWQKINNYWYYFNQYGVMQKGWLQLDTVWYYLGEDGRMFTNWQKMDNGTWYYFGTDGAMRTGWQKVNSTWYYLDENGKMLTGWQLIKNEYYYLHDGKMLTGWLNDSNGNTYYMDKTDGNMSRGWEQIDGTWYYFNEYGHRQKGWIKVSGTYYYLDENGKMASNTTLTIDSVKYTFAKSGACQNPPSSLSGMSDSYFDPSASQGTGTSSGSSSQAALRKIQANGFEQFQFRNSSSGNTNTRIVPIIRPVLLHREVPTAPARQMVLRRAQPFRFLEAATAAPLPRRAGLPVRQALRKTRQAAVPPAISAMYQAASTATARLTPHRRHQAPARQALRQIRPINGLTDLPPIRAIRFRRDRRRVLDGNKPYLQNI